MSKQNITEPSARSSRPKPVLPNSDGLPECEIEDLRTPYRNGYRELVEAILKQRKSIYAGTPDWIRAGLDRYKLTRELRRGMIRGLADDCIPLRGVIRQYEAKEIALLLELAVSGGIRMNAKEITALTLQLREAIRQSKADRRNHSQF